MYDYELIRSQRKTISMSIDDDNCRVIVRAPKRMSKRDIDNFVERHTDWIEKYMPVVEERMKNSQKITPELIKVLTARAKKEIPPKMEHFAKIMGVEPTGVKITSARKRFGSCSGRNSLCFSCLLMLYPSEAVDCVVVHELAHIKHHNHSADFYSFIYRYMSDYREREKLLKKMPEIPEGIEDFTK